MNVSAIVVTRGDVDAISVLESLPNTWERILWENGGQAWCFGNHGGFFPFDVPDVSVYGRYAAIEYASNDLIYVQDDDVIVSDPQAIVTEWYKNYLGRSSVVANMPQEFRHDGYVDSCLVGFGACFHRDLPARAFDRFHEAGFDFDWPFFNRTCDVVFTTLTPRVLVDVPRTNREFAEGPDRMYRQPDHVGERQRMLELARQVRDG